MPQPNRITDEEKLSMVQDLIMMSPEVGDDVERESKEFEGLEKYEGAARAVKIKWR